MSKPINIYILPDTRRQQLIKHTLRTVFFNKGLTCAFTTTADNALLTVGYAEQNDLVISEKFHQQLEQNVFAHQQLTNNGNIVNKFGGADIISTISYLVNSLQEYNDARPDEFGRFQYNSSLQYQLKNVETNTVQQLIDGLFKSHPKLQVLPVTNRKSRVFLTHDVDWVYAAIKEDGFYALKHLRFDHIARLMFNATLGTADWLNMDKIMKMEHEYGYKSVFYWLLYQSPMNSDYDFHSKSIQNQFNEIKNRGWENGVHKSMSDLSFADEAGIFGSLPDGNRYHFLKFALPTGYNLVEEAGIKLDTSLAFNDTFGLRNSFGQPFVPFNLNEDRPYRFVEIPQLMMDRTFFNERTPLADAKKKLFDFVEKNKYNCVFTIGWHNNFFTELKYKGYLQLYRDILAGLKDLGIEGISQRQIIEEYSLPLKD